MKTLIFKLFCVLTYAVILPLSFAHAEGGSQFGVLYGLSVPDADNVNPHKVFGVKGSAFLTPTFSLGGYFLAAQTNDIGSGGTQFHYNLPGIEAAFHLGGSGGDTFVGARLGISKIKTQQSGVDVLFSPYHYGAVCGYDYLIASWLVVGFEGSFVYVEGSKTNAGGTDYNQDSFSILSFLVSLQLKL